MKSKETKRLITSERTELKCHLCGYSTPTLKCGGCLDLVFCDTCADLYHKHQRRKFHKLDTLYPTPSSDDKNVLLLNKSQGIVQHSGSEVTYPCGCFRHFVFDEYKRLNPVPECATHQAPSKGTSENFARHRDGTEDNRSVGQQPKKETNANNIKAKIHENTGTWICEHCTFENGLDRKICAVCCKTHGVRKEEILDSTGSAGQDKTLEEKSDEHVYSQHNWSKTSFSDRFDKNADNRQHISKDLNVEYGAYPHNQSDYGNSNRGGPSSNFKNKMESGDEQTESLIEDISSQPQSIRDKFFSLFYTRKTADKGSNNVKNGANGEKQSFSKKYPLEQLIMHAEQLGFTRSDLSVAMAVDSQNPIQWLTHDWEHMVNEVINKATEFGCSQKMNDIGILSAKEAKTALYLHKNVNDAVVECVERRQKMFDKLRAQGNFPPNRIVDALSRSEGDVEVAYDFLVSVHISDETTHGHSTATTQRHHKITRNDDQSKSRRAVEHDKRQQQADNAMSENSESEEEFFETEDQVDNEVEELLSSLLEGSLGKPQLAERIREVTRLHKIRNKTKTSAVSAIHGSRMKNETNTDSKSKMNSEKAQEISEAVKKKRIRRFIADGLVSTKEKAEIAIQLMDWQFSESDAIDAAENCADLDGATSYLQQTCDQCYEKFSPSNMFYMLSCRHRFCLPCARHHFSEVVENGNILSAVCPVCEEPKLEDELKAADYFANLETLLMNLLDNSIHHLLREKLRNRPAVTDSKMTKKNAKEIRRLIAEGIFDSPERANIAIKLLELEIDEDDAIAAAKCCDSVEMAFTYLQKKACPICLEEFCIGGMVSMLNCEHLICPVCTKGHFSLKIRTCSIMEATCPVCVEHNIFEYEVADQHQYFSNLQTMLRNLVDDDVYQLIQQKLRDMALENDPNFHWCPNCGSGFIAGPDQVKAGCPECKVTSCVTCRRVWEKAHEGLTCAEFIQWKMDNDKDNQSAKLEVYLDVNGIDCPNPSCRARYVLARGGCMHFICRQCNYQFCQGCGEEFLKDEACKVSEKCKTRGLHAHHPRTCLYFLRDWEVARLTTLLNNNNVAYNIVQDNETGKCPIKEQREVSNGPNVDEVCGEQIGSDCCGLCIKHFVEHLVSVIKNHGLDIVNVMKVQELKAELQRHEKTYPDEERADEEYRNMLVQIVLKEIPLASKGTPEMAV